MLSKALQQHHNKMVTLKVVLRENDLNWRSVQAYKYYSPKKLKRKDCSRFEIQFLHKKSTRWGSKRKVVTHRGWCRNQDLDILTRIYLRQKVLIYQYQEQRSLGKKLSK